MTHDKDRNNCIFPVKGQTAKDDKRILLLDGVGYHGRLALVQQQTEQVL